MKNSHKARRSAIHFWLLMPIAVIIILLYLSSCTPKHGCFATHRMVGYSKLEKKYLERVGFGWIKCNTTGKVCIVNDTGIIASYYER